MILNDRARELLLYTAAQRRYEVLSQVYESDMRCTDTLRRSNCSGQHNRDLSHCQEMLRADLESYQG